LASCHCGKRLVPDKDAEEKGRNVYKCNTCGCFYAFSIVLKSNKCAEKEGVPTVKPKPKKKRGRKKKNYLSRSEE